MNIGEFNGIYTKPALRPNYFPSGARIFADDPIGFWDYVEVSI